MKVAQLFQLAFDKATGEWVVEQEGKVYRAPLVDISVSTWTMRIPNAQPPHPQAMICGRGTIWRRADGRLDIG